MSGNTTEDPKVLAIQITYMKELLERHETNTNKRLDNIDARFASLETLIRNYNEKIEEKYVTKEKFEALEDDVWDIQVDIKRVSWSLVWTLFSLLIWWWVWVVNKFIR